MNSEFFKRVVPPRPTALAQGLLSSIIMEGDRVIDATAGNGYDTLFLAKAVGETGQVLAFDVQAVAIRSAAARIAAAGFSQRVQFHEKSHGRIAEYAEDETITVVMFNLGYLPGEDHNLATERVETLRALEAAARVIRKGGALSVVCYPGHKGGDDEAGAVEKWMVALTGRGWQVAKYGVFGTQRPAPFLLLAAKTGLKNNDPP